jgi:filamentous hemagglutinin family protein
MKTRFWLSFLILTSVVAITQTAQAETYQPTNRIPLADKTLGTQVSGSGNNFNITGGLSKGQTLFHSFTDFSIPTNGQANFTNPVGNRDIITRVTGNLFSDINGLLNTNGANFLLINPNGVVFGNNAQLNVGKAFVVSTANSIDLVGAGGQKIAFGKSSNGDAPLLSFAPNVLFNVSALNMGKGSGQISNFGTLQTNNQSQYIGLIGGNVSLNGGKIIANGGRVDLGGLNSAGTVSVNSQGLVFSGSGLERSNVTLANGSSVSVRANQTLNPVAPAFSPTAVAPGSSINISANRIDISNSGNRYISTQNPINKELGGLDAGLEINSGVKTGTIGNINLDATGDIRIQKGAIFNLVRSGAEGRGGGVKIVGNNIIVTDKSEISTSLSENATGRGGDIEITARGNFSLVEPNYRDVVAPSEFAESVIAASTYGRGNSGEVTISAKGSVVVSDNNAITSTIEATGAGDSGGIRIDASSFTLNNGSKILTAGVKSPTGAGGSTGNIDITTTGDITIRGSNIVNKGDENLDRLSTIATNNSRKGNAGKITMTAPGKLSVLNRGTIVSSIRGNSGSGNSGGIKLNVGELLVSNVSGITTAVGAESENNAKGTAGNIDITATGNITVDETLEPFIVKKFEGSKPTPSAISSSLYGTGIDGKLGAAGNITITTPGKLSVGNHDGISSTVEQGGEGNGGKITLRAGELEVFNEGQIRTVASLEDMGKLGHAGNIDIKTTGNITIAGNKNPKLINPTGGGFYSKIASSSFRKGNTGKITIDAGGNISLINKGGIVSQCLNTCSSKTVDSASNITISSKQLNFDGGDISLDANDNAGNITIATQDSIVMRHMSGIATNSRGEGTGGNITINTQFLIALAEENNNITASAIKGRGGNVNIDAQAIFGIKFRPQATAESDILVSSDFGQSGKVSLDTLGKDPGRESTELPTVTRDATNQISQVCSASNRQNKLTVAGRGGLPPTANDPLTGDVVWQDPRAVIAQLDSPALGWVKDPLTGNVVWQNPYAASNQSAVNNATTNPIKIIPPAVGWVLDGKGKVTLIAAATEGQPTGTRVACPKTK